ncbi:MAG: acyl-CoA thioesterase [Chloroflexi bacterium]|nr:acyl-CoA thioesterase [Chloroflexota bacterium]
MTHDLTAFRYTLPIAVRFADMDPLNHVNNAKYFTYMETARIAYMRDVVELADEMKDLPLLLARATCDFKLPLTLEDTALVHVRVSRLGNTSIDMDYAITRQADGAVSALVQSVMVVFDHNAGAPAPIPQHWRDALLAYEPALS